MKRLTSLVIFITLLLLSCKSPKAPSDLIKPDYKKSDLNTTELAQLVTSNNDLGTGLNKKFVQSDLNSTIANLSKEEKQLLVKNNKVASTAQLNDLYNISFIDSLRSELKNKKKVQIDVSETFLLDYLTQEKAIDTLVVSYLNLKTPTNGDVTTFTYDVIAGDEIFYEIKNGTHEVKNIEFIEGETVRLRLSKIKKKKTVKGAFKIMTDNKLILNISNKGFFRNKGMLGSNLTIIIKKPVKKKGTLTGFVSDTTYVSKMVNKTVIDTTYKVVDTKLFKIEPILNITKKNTFNFPIIISSTDNLIGWGYWIGTTTADFDTYKGLEKDGDEAIISYAREELFELKPSFTLPVYSGKDLDILILNQSLDSRTANFNKNFAFYRSDRFIPRLNKKAEIRMTNTSTIYDYTINYRLVTVSTVERDKMVEVPVLVIKKSILIQMNDND
jgi:hypothetical protein